MRSQSIQPSALARNRPGLPFRWRRPVFAQVIAMQLSTAAFLSCPVLPVRTTAFRARHLDAPICPLPTRNIIICARKGAKKRANKSNPRKSSGKSSKPPPAIRDAEIDEQSTVPAPLASQDADIVTPFSSDDMITAELVGESEEILESSDQIPVADESKFKLPDYSKKGPKRKKKPRTGSVQAANLATPDIEDVPSAESIDAAASKYSTDAIRKLTSAYRTGGEDAQQLIDEIEKDPDFMFRTKDPEGEYDITSAIIGTGRPNKQGVYVLPYLQSGHILLLLVVLLATFVYYPGFPLTELDDTVRVSLKRGLLLTYGLNSVLAVLAFRDAKKRGQPPAFWSLKTALLGNIAFNELRRNTGTKGSEE